MGMICTGILVALSGCGRSTPSAPTVDPSELGRQKVAAFQKVADEVNKDPNAIAVAGALEEFTMIPFNAQESPQHAEEILRIYRERVQGKGGKYAAEIQQAVAPIRAGLGQTK
jgi:hypothetical protein